MAPSSSGSTFFIHSIAWSVLCSLMNPTPKLLLIHNQTQRITVLLLEPSEFLWLVGKSWHNDDRSLKTLIKLQPSRKLILLYPPIKNSFGTELVASVIKYQSFINKDVLTILPVFNPLPSINQLQPLASINPSMEGPLKISIAEGRPSVNI